MGTFRYITFAFMAFLVISASACSSGQKKADVLLVPALEKNDSSKSVDKSKIVPKSEPLEKSTAGSTNDENKEVNLLPALEIVSDSNSFGKTKIVISKGRAYVNTGVVQGIHKPPYEKVFFLSHENKSCFIWDVKTPYPFDHFTKQPVAIRRPFVKVGEENLFGFKCEVYQDYKDPKKASLKYIFSKELDAPRSLFVGYSSSFGQPASFGMPVLLKARYRGGWIKLYEITSVNKIKIDESIFDVPNYKEVKDLVNFAFFTPGSEDIENLFEYHFDSKKKK